MIVVVGSPSWGGERRPEPTGLAAAIALAAAARGAKVELVGRIGDDAAGDSLLIALAARGVGHVAVLRDPARGTVVRPGVVSVEEAGDEHGDVDIGVAIMEEADQEEPAAAARERTTMAAGAPILEAADVAMGLRYLTEFSVLVVTDIPEEALPVAVDATAYAGAHLIVLVGPDAEVPRGLPPETTVLAEPAAGSGDRFAQLVAGYAAGLDAGDAPADAFGTAAVTSGWEGAGE